MIKRLLTAACAIVLLTGAIQAAARDYETFGPAFTDLYVFGDSLSDSGNLFTVSAGFEPPSPPYFNGRFSDGPVWVESLALLLDLDVDFDNSAFIDPLANNQAIAGAFSGFGSESGGPFGVLNQVENFIAAGGRFGRRDLIIVFAGANDYFAGETNPRVVVRNLRRAIERLSRIGGRNFLVPNLPNLGDTPGGAGTGDAAGLNALTAAHNDRLARVMARLRWRHRLDIMLLDVNSTFVQLLDNPEVFGFDEVNINIPCLIQGTRDPTDPNDTGRIPTGRCPQVGDTFDSTGVLFWDLIHPSEAGHRTLAVVAHSALQALQNRTVKVGGDDDHDDDD